VAHLHQSRCVTFGKRPGVIDAEADVFLGPSLLLFRQEATAVATSRPPLTDADERALRSYPAPQELPGSVRLPLTSHPGAICAGSATTDGTDGWTQDPVQGPGQQREADHRSDLLLRPPRVLGDGLRDGSTNPPGQTRKGGFAQRSDQ
jgi:hypothetical protein